MVNLEGPGVGPKLGVVARTGVVARIGVVNQPKLSLLQALPGERPTSEAGH